MTTTLQSALPEIGTEIKNSAQNDPFRESATQQQQENGCIVEVAFDGANTRKWESSAKPPRRVPNSERRSREFLTEGEVEKLLTAAERQGRHGHRDSTLLLMAFRHALRVSELVSLRWDQVDLAQ